MAHGVVVLCVMWKMWCSRNKFIFEGTHMQGYQVAMQAQSLCRDIMKVYGNNIIQNHVVPRLVSWVKPIEGCISLNVDGSTITNPGMTGFGGLMRDHTGKFLCGFYGFIGHSNILHAEIMTILHGIALCWDMAVNQVVCYSDSLHVLGLIRDGDQDFNMFGNEIASIRGMLSRNWDVQLHHILREGNHCADLLAKMGARGDASLVVLSSTPMELNSLLMADVMGVTFVRH